MKNKKQKLIELAFEKAKKELPNGSKSSIAAYFSVFFEEKFGFSKDEKTYTRYYNSLVEQKSDYNIDAITLDWFSSYLGYHNFDEFCQEIENAGSSQEFGDVKIDITHKDRKILENYNDTSKVEINITNAPVFNLPEFISKHKNSLGIIGVLILGSLLTNKYELLDRNEKNRVDSAITKPAITTSDVIPRTFAEFQNNTVKTEEKIQSPHRKKECMYWDNNRYISIFCDQKRNLPHNAIAIDEDQLELFQKIEQPDTLTIVNSLGKVWYDKTDNNLEFFTYHGIHPTNGKTLKPITKYIIEKYIINSGIK